MSNKDSPMWLEAMQSKMDLMHTKQIWTFVNPPKGIVSIRCKSVYKRKIGSNGKVETYKASF